MMTTMITVPMGTTTQMTTRQFRSRVDHFATVWIRYSLVASQLRTAPFWGMLESRDEQARVCHRADHRRREWGSPKGQAR